MYLNKSFAEILKQKMTIGSTRSILLNALPGRLATRLPLTDLEIIENGLSNQFLSDLTSKTTFSLKFSIDLTEQGDDVIKQLIKVQKRLTIIKYEHDDYLKEHGVETFGFGFPILVRRNIKDPKKFIAAPLFIFPLEIKQTFDKTRQWIIGRNDDSEIRLNEVFASYLENEEHIKMPSISEEMLADDILNKNEIESFCHSLLSRFENNTVINTSWNHLEVIPEKSSITEAFLKNSTIIWNGVFGLYKSQKQSQIKEMETLLENYDKVTDRDTEFEWEHNHSPIVTDPSQNCALRSLSTNRDLVIQGPPGTGKSQTLTAVVSSALANNKKVLVVCEKRTALEVLKSNLEQLLPEVSKCIALIEDVTRDRSSIVEIVRNRTARFLMNRHLKLILEDDIKRFENKANTIESQYEALRRPIWRNLKWKDLVSLWISTDKSDEELENLYPLQKLFQKQNLDDLQFSKLLATIEDASLLFSNTAEQFIFFESLLKTPEVIKSGYDKDVVYLIKEIISKLPILKSELASLKNQYLLFSSEENQKVINLCNEQLHQLINLVNKWQDNQTDFISPSRIVKIKALFLKKYKNLLQDSTIAKDILGAINVAWLNYFGNNISISDLPDKISFIKNKAESVLNERTHNILKQPIDLIKSPGFDNNKCINISRQLKQLYHDVSIYIEQRDYPLNTPMLDDIENNILAFLNNLNAVISQEQKIRDYFIWKAFEMRLDVTDKDWIRMLIDKKTEDWKDLVNQAWLYFKLLNEDESGRFPTNDSTIEILKSLRLDIQIQQKEIIKTNIENWFSSGQTRLKEKGLSINQVFNIRGSKGVSRNSLRKIIQMSLDTFTDFFPVMMLNPGTCSSLLPLKKGFFDIVLFDEASQLRIEDTFPALLRGKQVIVSGDSQQMPPSNYFESSSQMIDEENTDDDVTDDSEENGSEEQLTAEMANDNSREMAMSESLLQFAVDSDFRQTYLDMHYRSRHPDLIMFSNVCFYNSRLIPMPEKVSTPPIKFIRVDGLYDNRQNIDEAREVIRILKEEIDGSLSVGVATFNLNQRNLILDYINDERASNDVFSNKMNDLERLGFFVKNLENIQGDEKDIIIISTTFGVKNDHSFRLGFGPISQKNGYRLLNVIITRAKHKLYILTSIPETRILEYRQRLEISRKVDGTAGLLAYLAYSKAVSTDNQEEKKGILDYIESKISRGEKSVHGDSIGLTESPFEEEVASWLYEVIDKDRIHLQYPCGGFRIDMVIFPKNAESNKKLAIECDGAAYHSDQLAWHYDIYRQQQLEESGFIFHRIWSTNWWRRPEDEFQKLLKSIEELQ